MSAESVTAICALLTAVAALLVSIMQTRAIFSHNYQSVRPILELRIVAGYDGLRIGIKLRNEGLGPAIIRQTQLAVDGKVIGGWDSETVLGWVRSLPQIPMCNTLDDGSIVSAGSDYYLFSIVEYDTTEHEWFWELIAERMEISIFYESAYRNKEFYVKNRLIKSGLRLPLSEIHVQKLSHRM